METLCTFKFTYKNGISQTKALISKETYDEIKNIINNVMNLEGQIAGLSRKNKKRIEIENEINEMTKPISELGEYFVVGSPLYKAWNGTNGLSVLELPLSQGGPQYINIECLDTNYMRNIDNPN